MYKQSHFAGIFQQDTNNNEHILTFCISRLDCGFCLLVESELFGGIEVIIDQICLLTDVLNGLIFYADDMMSLSRS